MMVVMSRMMLTVMLLMMTVMLMWRAHVSSKSRKETVWTHHAVRTGSRSSTSTASISAGDLVAAIAMG
jgi:hypothetical protein